MMAIVGGMLLLAAGCGKGPGGGAKRIPRDQDAAAVVIVDSPDERVVSFSEENEPNNQANQANVLALGNGARGSLDGETDVDVYRVDVSGPGILAVQLGGIEGVDLVLTVRDGAGTVLARSDRGPALTVEGVPNLAVAPGAYYLEVSEFVKKQPRASRKKSRKQAKAPAAEDPPAGRAGRSPLYELTTSLAAQPVEQKESEPNETAEHASEILYGEPVYGYLGWADDVDVWKVSVEGFAPEYGLDIDLSAVSGVTPKLTVRDGEGVALLEYAGSKDRGLSVRNLVATRSPDRSDRPGSPDAAVVGEKPPRYFYIELRAQRSNPVDTYRLEVVTRLLEPDEETEPNDKEATAVALYPDARQGTSAGASGRLGKGGRDGTRRGYSTIGDVDYYRIVIADEPALLSVTVKPLGDADLELSVLSDGQTVAMADQGKTSASESLADVRLAAGKVALVKVAGRGSLGGNAAYELRYILDPASPGSTGQPGDEDDDGLDRTPGEDE